MRSSGTHCHISLALNSMYIPRGCVVWSQACSDVHHIRISRGISAYTAFKCDMIYGRLLPFSPFKKLFNVSISTHEGDEADAEEYK